jgi:glycosyltransferase involved in cell wall biosynthesis
VRVITERTDRARAPSTDEPDTRELAAVRAPIVLVTPIVPLPGTNGLAMRAGMWLDALATHAPVHVVVVPVSGPAEPSAWARVGAASCSMVDWVHPDHADRHLLAQLGDARWRAALEATAPLPTRVTIAPPSLAIDAQARLEPLLAGRPPPAVVTMREYLVPFGLALADRLGAARTVIDLDDDVEPLLHQLGHADDADAYGRIARHWLPRADLVVASSALDADALTRRYELARVSVVPNSVRRPARVSALPGNDRLLFVGNLTYSPNVDAARTLALDVLPLVRARRPNATLHLVGRAAREVRALAEADGVVVEGEVGDLAPSYADADVVVVALRAGAGTRIKVLEAFAHQRPVVATPIAVAGLAVAPDRDVLVGDTPDALALAVERVLADGALAHRLVTAATVVLDDHYAPEIVAPIVRHAVLAEQTGSAP